MKYAIVLVCFVLGAATPMSGCSEIRQPYGLT